MARPGVTYNDVAQAALALSGQGTAPTIDNVRQHLGTGSSSTIGPHLKTWKERQSDTTLLAHKEKLPEDLIVLMKGLWDRVLGEAHTEINAVKQSTAQTIEHLTQKIQQVAAEKVTLEQQLIQSKQKEQKNSNDNLSLSEALSQLQHKYIALDTESKAQDERFAEKQERIHELQRLHQQAQHNLEHYRESVREERAKEQQHYELRVQSLEQSQQHIAKENHALKNQYDALHQRWEALDTTHNALQEKHLAATTQLNTLSSQLTTTQHQLETAHASANEWKREAEKMQGINKEQETLTANLKTHVTRLLEKLSLTEKQLHEITQQNKSLAHEKWALGQEAARLAGQLKQFSSTAI